MICFTSTKTIGSLVDSAFCLSLEQNSCFGCFHVKAKGNSVPFGLEDPTTKRNSCLRARIMVEVAILVVQNCYLRWD